MIDPKARAENVQNLRNILRDQGLTEAAEAASDITTIVCQGDGWAKVTEFTEDFPLVYHCPCPCPKHRPEGPAA